MVRSLVFVACYAGAALVAGGAVFLGLPGDGAVIVTCLAVVGALVLSNLLTRFGRWAQFIGFFAGATFVVLTGLATHSTALAVRGDRVTATVTGVVVTHGRRGVSTYRYALQMDDQRPIAGRLAEDEDEFALGERVRVVVDRAGRIAPKTTGEVDAAGPLWTAALTAFVLTGLVGVVAGRRRSELDAA